MIFDYIHSLDSKKLADKISSNQKDNNLEKKFFIQVNIGNEEQKSGIAESELPDFYNYCKGLKLNIIGLMCIPPVNEEPALHFALLKKFSDRNGLKNLSMGMSSDFQSAIALGATHVRIGSAIFGERINKPIS